MLRLTAIIVPALLCGMGCGMGTDWGSASDMLARFRQEVKLARRVSHRNVVRTYDLSEVGESVFLTMEFIRGRSLRSCADDGRRPPRLSCAGPLAGALATAQVGCARSGSRALILRT